MDRPWESDGYQELLASVPKAIPMYTQLVVVGGGMSGVAAAVTAARLGTTTVLIEPTHMLGGQAGPSGVSAMDVTMHYAPLINGYGFWGELRDRIIEVYETIIGKHPNVSQYRDESFAPNPSVVDWVLSRMLDEAGVSLFRNVGVTEAAMTSGTGQVTTTAGTITGKIVVDATEDGCVTRLSGIAHRVANSVFDGTTYSGDDVSRARIQDITQTAMIRKYEPGTMPDELRVTEMPAGYEHYRREITSGYPHGPGKSRLDHPNGFAGYRGAPDLASDRDYTGSQWESITRTSLNFRNDQAITASYLLDPVAKIRYERSAINRTLSIIYYLQNELGLEWSVATDEGFATGPGVRDPRTLKVVHPEVVRHFPPIPYIRESARIVGAATLTGKMIFRRTNKSAAPWDVTAIAMGTYPPDLHGGRSQKDLETDLDESLTDKPTVWREGPFPIPMATLHPRTGSALIAAEKNISASRIASGALRLHPTVTAIGQAVGVLAAMAIKHGVTPITVPTLAVQAMLARLGAHVAPCEIKGLSQEDPRFAMIQLAAVRQLIEPARYVPLTRQHVLECDLDASAAVGSTLMSHVESWLAPLLDVSA